MSIFTQNSSKKALLIGINYDNDNYNNDNLKGCENDCNELEQLLKEKLYFDSSNITKISE